MELINHTAILLHPDAHAYNDDVNVVFFWLALVIAVIGLVVAGRFLFNAWSDYRLKERRAGIDRRRQSTSVPMERRRRDRRH